MASVSNLGYLVLGVSDLDAWEHFAVDIIGLQAGQRVAGESLALRMDDYAQRLLLEKNDADDLLAAGWEFDTDEQLDAFVAHAAAAGVKVDEADAALTKRRRVGRLFTCLDPDGVAHEFFTRAERAPAHDMFRSKVLKSRFNTGRLGVGHFVAVPKSVERTDAFCKQVLGLKVSDYARGEMAPGVVLEIAFFHALTGRHHSMATAKVPFPFKKRIHHILVEAIDPNDVGLAYDRCTRANVPVAMELGHHPNDQMFSFYVQTPSGFALEFGSGGVVVDDDNWEVRQYAELSDWGHRHHPPARHEPRAGE
ncbi:3-methylcatechol 2,3-dioxygenase [Paraburkholderia caffeinitolerans]|uniref:3-methylcatechol 2,3-dioxygenase n=1 Tax=Paraburkholderia caffeinitolerans TaxID=1723730 RepID=A0A6J5FX39_9BURK|nr:MULTISPECIES: VOC family protein [Paraburkholderia]CAB3788521.1 3-methylcatechol 2,3-dioxygenase [Paraburkholderia caffeinitolerans]